MILGRPCGNPHIGLRHHVAKLFEIGVGRWPDQGHLERLS